MPVSIIEADVKKDIKIFTDLLNKNRRDKVKQNRFEWLYLDNPQGQARAWIVYDDKTGEPVAFTSVLPRMVRVNGEDIVCWNCCDFSVNQKFRTLGVAVKLRRKAKECVDNGEIRALYAHPNDRMKVIHDRAGHSCIGEMRRYVKLLRADTQLEARIKNRVISILLSPFANLLLKAADEFIKTDTRYSAERVINKEFGREYDELFDYISKLYNIIGDRRALYLNWRYNQSPLYKTERLEIRYGGSLAGYIIYYMENNIAVFKDILCIPDENIMKTLFSQWFKILRKENVSAVSAGIMNENPVIEFLKKTGFRLRPEERSPVYAYAGNDDELKNLWLNGANWYMTVGDRDV